MKIKIDRKRCQGHARCIAIAPQVFKLDDNGYISQDEIDVPADQEALARRAVRACPERILKIEGE